MTPELEQDLKRQMRALDLAVLKEREETLLTVLGWTRATIKEMEAAGQDSKQ